MKSLQAKIFFLLVIAIGFSSCKENKCKHVTCPTNLECSEGACVCPNGYEGTNCDTLSYKKYVGSYLVSESCETFPSYTATMYWYADTLSPGEMVITPFFEAGPLYVYIINLPGSLGLNFTVPSTNINTAEGTITVSGSGQGVYSCDTCNTIARVYLYLTYNNPISGDQQTCTETLTKF